MALLTVTDINVYPTWTSVAAGGDKFQNDGKTCVIVKNSSGSQRTVTFVAERAWLCPEEDLHNLVLTIANGAYGIAEPVLLSRAVYNATGTGLVSITYSGTGMTINCHRTLV